MNISALSLVQALHLCKSLQPASSPHPPSHRQGQLSKSQVMPGADPGFVNPEDYPISKALCKIEYFFSNFAKARGHWHITRGIFPVLESPVQTTGPDTFTLFNS